MAGIRFTFEFEGEAQIDRTLLNVTENVQDATVLWEELADRFARVETRQFKTQGAYGSGGWQELSPRYAAWKARHYPGKPILQRTGALVKSLTRRPFGVEVITPASMTVGSGLDYGRRHQAGGGSLPRRRPVELPEGERRYWVTLIQRFIRRGHTA
ncbi:MAG: phage virion morphogenesis protein [Burkholderiaceae bacterium]